MFSCGNGVNDGIARFYEILVKRFGHAWKLNGARGLLNGEFDIDYGSRTCFFDMCHYKGDAIGKAFG